MSDLTELELAEIALREDTARSECYLREGDPAKDHTLADGVVCARCYGALVDENVRLRDALATARTETRPDV